MRKLDVSKARARDKAFAALLPALILAAGLIGTVAAFLRAQSSVEEYLAQKLASESKQLAARVQQQFALQEETLRGLVGLFVASGEATRADFSAYVGHLDLAMRFPAAVEFRYARHLRRHEVPAWQRQVMASLTAAGEVPFMPAPQPGGSATSMCWWNTSSRSARPASASTYCKARNGGRPSRGFKPVRISR